MCRSLGLLVWLAALWGLLEAPGRLLIGSSGLAQAESSCFWIRPLAPDRLAAVRSAPVRSAQDRSAPGQVGLRGGFEILLELLVPS